MNIRTILMVYLRWDWNTIINTNGISFIPFSLTPPKTHLLILIFSINTGIISIGICTSKITIINIFMAKISSMRLSKYENSFFTYSIGDLCIKFTSQRIQDKTTLHVGALITFNTEGVFSMVLSRYLFS